MENNLNETQSTPNTSNPQDAVPADGASNASDFQSTAPYDALNQEAENLTVQKTGDPLEAQSVSAVSDASVVFWVIFGVIVFALSLVLLFKLIKEGKEDDAAVSSAASATSTKPKATKTAAKKTPAKAKKASTKKKSAPNQRRKKSSAKRR